MLRLKERDQLDIGEVMEKDDFSKLFAKEGPEEIDFSIIIPTRGRLSYLKDLLNSIK